MKLLNSFSSLLACIAWCAFVGIAVAAPPAARPVAYAGINPVAWLASELACGRVEVRTLLPDGSDPHTFEPPARAISALSRADAYLSLGLPFEKRVVRSLPKSVALFDLRSGDGHEEQGGHSPEDHAKAAGHDLSIIHDPHVWLTPDGMSALAERARDALDAIDPEGAGKRRAVFSALVERLAAMDSEFAAALAPHAGKPVVVHHPSWARFAVRYGLRLEAIEEEGREPSTRRLVEIVEDARKRGVKTVFAEPQFSRRAAEAVAAQLGGKVVVVDPLAGDWESNMRGAAAAFAKALEEEEAAQ